MIFTYLQCLIDFRDSLVLVSPIKTRFLATVGSFLYFISYYIFFRNKTISNYTVNFYLYDKLELALSFNSPPPPYPCSLTSRQSLDAPPNPQAASCYQC